MVEHKCENDHLTWQIETSSIIKGLNFEDDIVAQIDKLVKKKQVKQCPTCLQNKVRNKNSVTEYRFFKKLPEVLIMTFNLFEFVKEEGKLNLKQFEKKAKVPSEISL